MSLSLKNIWSKISRLGINDDSSDFEAKSSILNNQMNFLMAFTMVILSIILAIYRNVHDIVFSLGDLRVYLVMAVAVINLVLSAFGRNLISKVSLIFLTPFILLIYPTLTGFVEEESFFYYPLTVIGFSVVPQLLLKYSESPVFYVTSIIYYLVLLIGLDKLIIIYAPSQLEGIKTQYEHIHVINIIISFIVFFFIHLAIIYLKRVNQRAEKSLLVLNEKLNEQNKKLDLQNEKLMEVNRSLKSTQQQLVYSEKMASLGVLTAGIAHEINNPLNFISGGSFIISDFLNDVKNGMKIDDSSMAYAEQGSDMISKGIDQAAAVVSSLMTFSYSGKPKKQREDLNEIVESTLMFQKHRIPAGLRFEKEYNLDKPVDIYAEKIHQVVLNLIDNALFEISNSSIPEKDKFLFIETGMNDDGWVYVKIANSARHIDPDIAGKLFDPFFTTKEPGEGTGLGLSIVNNLIKEHNGTISFTNIDKGVEFMFTIPFDGTDNSEG
jgi:signal transduction histidine kinase